MLVSKRGIEAKGIRSSEIRGNPRIELLGIEDPGNPHKVYRLMNK